MEPFVKLGGNVATISCTPPPEPATHDTQRCKYHMADIAEFAQTIELAANRSLPNHGRSRYQEVKVLLLRWEEDELQVEWELNDLSKVFEDYGFDTETWLIPTSSPHLKMMGKAVDFVSKHENEDCLLIVYYGGHANVNTSRQATWSCKRDLGYSSLEWSACQSAFEQSKSDVLLLLDCCSAAAAAPSPSRSASITETIAACGWETWAPEPGKYSFTNALIEVLEDWLIKRKVFSAAQLHSEVLCVLKQPRPRRNKEISKAPVYIVTTSNPNVPSIQIRSRKPREQSEPMPPQSISSVSSPDSKANGVEAAPAPHDFDLRSLCSTLPNKDFVVPHVIISVALEKDQELDSEAFRHWFKQFPALGQYAKIQGIYRGYSTLMLLTVPVVVWNLLPENLACTFVGYAKSDNLWETAPSATEINQSSTSSTPTDSPIIPTVSLTDARQYAYQRLHDPRSIRLLSIQPEDQRTMDSTINISFQQVSLENAPSYAALSYVWGSLVSPIPVFCDGAVLNVTQNLAGALRTLRKTGHRRKLWIDALCINQSDMGERNAQVTLMRDIYVGANLVLIWLGEASQELDPQECRPNTDIGIEFIHDIGSDIQRILRSGKSLRDAFQHKAISMQLARIGSGTHQLTPLFRGLKDIFHRGWWQRVWILQEVSLAQSSVMLCGDASVDFTYVETFVACSKFISDLAIAESLMAYTQQYLTTKQYTQTRGGRSNLEKTLWILMMSRSLECTDPRDKVYGVLGLLEYSEGFSALPDYSKSVASVYEDTAWAIIQQSKSLDILSHSVLTPRMPGLPSWVPDWSHSNELKFDSQLFHASQDSNSAGYIISTDHKVLRIKGIVFDTVQKVATINYEDQPTQSSDGRVYARRFRKWRGWYQFVSLYCPQTYPTGMLMREAFLHTLCWNSFGDERFDRKATEYIPIIETWFNTLNLIEGPHNDVATMIMNAVPGPFINRVSQSTEGQVIALTTKNYLVIGPETIKGGDIIAIILGATVPLILRPVANHFLLIGACYVHGIMDGEAFTTADQRYLREFDLH